MSAHASATVAGWTSPRGNAHSRGPHPGVACMSTPHTQSTAAPPRLTRQLGRWGLWMLMINGMIGAGIFGIPAGAANSPLIFQLDRGQQAQISQATELTGSVIQSDKPIGFLAGQSCMRLFIQQQRPSQSTMHTPSPIVLRTRFAC